MDLGIEGKRALVCASSKGLGLACARALASEGVNLIMNARGTEALSDESNAIKTEFGVAVETVPCDVTSMQGQKQLIEVAQGVDILVNNAGGPPPGMWTDWQRDDFVKALDANMLAPIALMSALLPRMIDKGWGRVVNITSQSVKSPIAALGLSNSARAGLTGYVAGTSRQVAPMGVCINNLLPGSHATARIDALDKGTSDKSGITFEEARAARQSTIPVGRDGNPKDFGAMCAFLCSQYANFMVGQNVLLDGGNVNATI